MAEKATKVIFCSWASLEDVPRYLSSSHLDLVMVRTDEAQCNLCPYLALLGEEVVVACVQLTFSSSMDIIFLNKQVTRAFRKTIQ